MFSSRPIVVYVLSVAIAALTFCEAQAEDLSVLFLGGRNGSHRPREQFEQILPVLQARGIELDYTDDMAEMTLENLRRYDALLLYANIDRIDPAHAEAILAYVAGGGGFVPLHCATYCFRNSPEMVALMGGQFQRHEWARFRTTIVEPDHPIMAGFGGFESEDETYVHTLHNEENRTVLSYRVEGSHREPWTWVRTHGDGRVFYTAWGHDHRTWGHPGFQNLVERGIRWAAGDDPSQVPPYADAGSFEIPEMTVHREDAPEFTYVDVGPKIPNYPPSARWGVQDEPYSLMQEPLPAEGSMKHYVMPKGFELELFADENDGLTKAVAMNWDERGRLWVCVTVDYPNELTPDGEGRDRVVILEDTDRDGRADKSTLFAEGLSIPTAILCYRGGAIVQDGGQTVFLKDTDNDGKADVRRVLITGWRMNDTHGTVSNFRYGLDNWVWAMQGYNDSSPVLHGAGGEQTETQRFRQGFFRFHLDDGDPPVVTDLEFLRSTDNNTWGLGISEEGLIFGSTANRNPSVFMPIPNRYYEQVRGWRTQLTLRMIADTYLFKPVIDEAKVRQVDQHGGYTAGAGHALYTARRYPQSWWNRTAFVCGPTGKLIGTFVLEPDGAGFRSSNRFNLVASYDEWSAPIMAEVGPDGNVWFIDWYNYIVQHNPTPQGFQTGRGAAYQTDLRDKKHGRIYRLEYGSDDAPWPNLAGDVPSSDLVAALTHPVMLWRLQAQRLLVDRRDMTVVPQLIKLVQDETTDGIGLNVGAIHALWTLHGIGALGPSAADGRSSAEAIAAVEGALAHPSRGVRRNALQVLAASSSRVAAIIDGGLLSDEDPQVRLAAFLALADMETSDGAGRAIAAAFDAPANRDDPWIADAATSAAARHAASFLAAVVSADDPSSTLLERTRIVAEHFARSGGEGVEALVARLGDANPDAVAAVVEGLFAGWPDDAPPALDKDAAAQLVGLLEKLPAASQTALVQLGDRWQVAGFEEYIEEIASTLLAELDDAEQGDADRAAAAARLVSFQSQNEEVIDTILSRITPQSSPTLARGLVEALGNSSAPALAETIIAELGMFSPAVKEAALRMLLQREATVEALLAAVDEGRVHVSDLTLDMQQALLGHRDRRIAFRARRLLRESGGLPSPDRQAVIEELASVTQTTGDVARGQEVFKKNCSQCHVHGDLGERIGPDLTGMAVHPKTELLEQILDPSRSVEGNFRMYIIQAAGRTLQGLVAGENRTAIELIDTEGKRHTILREDIDEGGFFASQKSIMPEGFEKQMTQQELADLLEFLTHRGQYVPVDMRKAATIASDRGMFTDLDDRRGRLVFPDWGPKEFDGVPFRLIDPQDGRVPNAIMLRSRMGGVARQMPMDVELPVNMPAKAIHMLGGVSGWGYPYSQQRSTSMIVRLYYADGSSEEHELVNGVHFADYNGQEDVPESEHAFNLRGRQVRYLKIEPNKTVPIERMQLIKGTDQTSPIVMAITIETG